MDLKALEKLGAFVSHDSVKAKVVWNTVDENGEPLAHDFDVTVVRPSYGEIEDVVSQAEGKIGIQSSLISTCIRLGKDGEQRLSYEQVRSLDPGLATALVNAIKDAGVDLAKKQNRQPPKKSSGTKSS